MNLSQNNQIFLQNICVLVSKINIFFMPFLKHSSLRTQERQNHRIRVGQVLLTFQNQIFGPSHFYCVKNLLFSEYCQLNPIHILIERKISEIPNQVFSAALLIQCSQISMSRQRAPAPEKNATNVALSKRKTRRKARILNILGTIV